MTHEELDVYIAAIATVLHATLTEEVKASLTIFGGAFAAIPRIEDRVWFTHRVVTAIHDVLGAVDVVALMEVKVIADAPDRVQ